MSERPDFVRALRRAEERWANVRPSRKLDARVEASLSRPRLSPALTALAAAMVFAVVFLLARPSRAPEATPVRPQSYATFTPASCAPAEPAAELALEQSCVVELADLRIEALTPLRLQRTNAGVHLIQGTGRFEARRSVVFVSGQRIEALGANFVAGDHKVEVLAGELRLTGRETLTLSKGQLYVWTEAPQAQVVKEKPRETRPVVRPRIEAPPVDETREETVDDSPPIAAQVEVVEPPPEEWSEERTARAVERISELRAQGRFQEAARSISTLLRARMPERALEVLSFERGEILEHKLSEKGEACAHWRWHAARFQGGRYHDEVERALSRCGF